MVPTGTIGSDPWADDQYEKAQALHFVWLKAVSAVVAAILLLAVVASIATESAYGTAVWWTEPGTIHWCGRDYSQTGSTVTRARIPVANLIGSKPYPVVQIGTFPPVIGHPLLARVTPSSSRNRFSPPLPCAMTIYLQTNHDNYTPYGIEGGP